MYDCFSKPTFYPTSDRFATSRKFGYRRSRTSGLRWRVAVSENKRTALKYPPHILALHADPFAMNDAHVLKSALMSFVQIFFYNCFDLSGWD